jgi:uncharacterized protein (DUF1499 family)
MQKLLYIFGLAFGACLVGFIVLYFIVGLERFWDKVGGDPDMGSVDFAKVQRTDTPNQYLICPQNLCLDTRDAVSPIFNMPVDMLQDTLRDIIISDRNIKLEADLSSNRSERYLARSPFLRFPDTINVQYFALTDTTSTLAIFARAKLGLSDLGANKQRIITWLAQLEK